MNSMDTQCNITQTHTKRNLTIYDIITTWMDLEGIMLSEINKWDRERQIVYDATYMWNLKMKTNY